MIPSNTATPSAISAWNTRIDALLNWPPGHRTLPLLGRGFTGTNFTGDTTHNAYDGGFNVK